MAQPIRTIAIIGGGSAGWMTAALLSRLLRPDYKLVLVESDEIGTVGVGEGTIPPVKQFNALLGIDEAEFLHETGGTFKLGVEFVDWGRPGDSFMHAFGPIGPRGGLVRTHQHWLRLHASGASLPPIGDYNINRVAARSGKFQHPATDRPSSPLADITYAYHLDAMRYARYLRSYSERRGLERIEGRIESVRLRGEDGFVAAVVLADGREVMADFFVDCSGFRSLLLGETLGVPFESWSQWLLCDRAIATPCASAGPIEPRTRATAHGAGWRWRIPLQHRTGNGIVYSSAFLSDDEAAARLEASLDGEAQAAPRLIRFAAGRRRQAWVKNCVAVGLAGGFLEPLESTSLHMVQSALLRLVSLFPDGGFDPATIAAYNRQAQREAERVRDFIILHYKLTERRDTEFWRTTSAMAIPDSLSERLDLFRGRARVFRDPDDLFAEESWLLVLLGKNVRPERHDPLAELTSVEDARANLASVQAVVRRCVDVMPRHEDTLATLRPRSSTNGPVTAAAGAHAAAA